MQVADIDKIIQKVKENGGKIIEPKISITGIGWYVICA
jgi:predicted enzyme related to lactoylglutathione lyase